MVKFQEMCISKRHRQISEMKGRKKEREREKGEKTGQNFNFL